MSVISGNFYHSDNPIPIAKKSEHMGQADFLKLMTEQLKHQDPLKPMENSEFLGQLAQFSTVQGINNLENTVKGMSEALVGDQVLRGAALVGHKALVPFEKIDLNENDEIKGLAIAPGPGIVNFEIKDSNGNLVKTISVKAEEKGEVAFSWDGTDTNGKQLTPGNYSITATQANAATGDKAPLTTYANATVESVNIGSDGLYLNLAGLGTVPIGYVLRIS